MNRPKYDVIMISDGRFMNFEETRLKDVKNILFVQFKRSSGKRGLKDGVRIDTATTSF